MTEDFKSLSAGFEDLNNRILGRHSFVLNGVNSVQGLDFDTLPSEEVICMLFPTKSDWKSFLQGNFNADFFVGAISRNKVSDERNFIFVRTPYGSDAQMRSMNSFYCFASIGACMAEVLKWKER